MALNRTRHATEVAAEVTLLDLASSFKLSDPALDIRSDIVVRRNEIATSSYIVEEPNPKCHWLLKHVAGDGNPAATYSIRFRGMGSDSVSATSFRVFITLARTAWQLLPHTIKDKLDAPKFASGEHSWVMAVYGMAWQMPSTPGVLAPRCLRTKDGWLEVETFLRDTKPRAIEDGDARISPCTKGPPYDRTFFASPELPPAEFFAELSPGLFLASKLTLEWIVQSSRQVPTPTTAKPRTAKPRTRTSPALGSPNPAGTSRPDAPGHLTKKYLCELGEISGTTFDEIRIAANVQPPAVGFHGHCYTLEEFGLMIQKAMTSSGKRLWRIAGTKWTEHEQELRSRKSGS